MSLESTGERYSAYHRQMPGRGRCSQVLVKASLCRVWWIAGGFVSRRPRLVTLGRWWGGERLTSTSQVPALNVMIGRMDILRGYLKGCRSKRRRAQHNWRVLSAKQRRRSVWCYEIVKLNAANSLSSSTVGEQQAGKAGTQLTAEGCCP